MADELNLKVFADRVGATLLPHLRDTAQATNSFRQAANTNNNQIRKIAKDLYDAISSQRNDISSLANNIQVNNSYTMAHSAKADQTNSLLAQNLQAQNAIIRQLNNLNTTSRTSMQSQSLAFAGVRQVLTTLGKKYDYGVTRLSRALFGRLGNNATYQALGRGIGGGLLAAGGVALGSYARSLGEQKVGAGETPSESEDKIKKGLDEERRAPPSGPTPSGPSGPSSSGPSESPSLKPIDTSKTGELSADKAGNVNPVEYYKRAVKVLKESNSPLLGFVPKDAAKFGIKTGSAEEWARVLTQLTKQESSFNVNTSGDKGQSHGLSQMKPGQYGLRSMEDVRNPEKAMKAMIKQFEQFIPKFGSIAGKGTGPGTYQGYGGASAYFGPLRRIDQTNEYSKHNKEIEEILKKAGSLDPSQQGPGQGPGQQTPGQQPDAERVLSETYKQAEKYGIPEAGSTNEKGGFNRVSGNPYDYAKNIVTIQTPYGPARVDKNAATAFTGFFNDLKAAGAPIKKLGSYNIRPKKSAGAGHSPGSGWSQHSYGNAVDLDDDTKLSSAMLDWIKKNPGVLDNIKKRWGMVTPRGDAPHMEWRGVISPDARQSLEKKQEDAKKAGQQPQTAPQQPSGQQQTAPQQTPGQQPEASPAPGQPPAKEQSRLPQAIPTSLERPPRTRGIEIQAIKAQATEEMGREKALEQPESKSEYGPNVIEANYDPSITNLQDDRDTLSYRMIQTTRFEDGLAKYYREGSSV